MLNVFKSLFSFSLFVLIVLLVNSLQLCLKVGTILPVLDEAKNQCQNSCLNGHCESVSIDSYVPCTGVLLRLKMEQVKASRAVFPNHLQPWHIFPIRKSHNTPPNKNVAKSILIIFLREAGIAELARFVPSIPFFFSLMHEPSSGSKCSPGLRSD